MEHVPFARRLATEVISSFCSSGSSLLNDVIIGKWRTNESYCLSAHVKWCHLAAEESNQNLPVPGFRTPNLSIGNVIKFRMKLYFDCVSFMKEEREFLNKSTPRRFHKSTYIPCVYWLVSFCLFIKLIVMTYVRNCQMKEEGSRENYVMRKSYTFWDIMPSTVLKAGHGSPVV